MKGRSLRAETSESEPFLLVGIEREKQTGKTPTLFPIRLFIYSLSPSLTYRYTISFILTRIKPQFWNPVYVSNQSEIITTISVQVSRKSITIEITKVKCTNTTHLQCTTNLTIRIIWMQKSQALPGPPNLLSLYVTRIGVGQESLHFSRVWCGHADERKRGYVQHLPSRDAPLLFAPMSTWSTTTRSFGCWKRAFIAFIIPHLIILHHLSSVRD